MLWKIRKPVSKNGSVNGQANGAITHEIQINEQNGGSEMDIDQSEERKADGILAVLKRLTEIYTGEAV